MMHDVPREGARANRSIDGESDPGEKKLLVELHRKYIVELQEKRNTFGIRGSLAPRYDACSWLHACGRMLRRGTRPKGKSVWICRVCCDRAPADVGHLLGAYVHVSLVGRRSNEG